MFGIIPALKIACRFAFESNPPSRFELITIYDILCLPRKEAPQMGNVQFTDVQTHPTEFLDLTSLTLGEFQQLVPPFEAAFQAHMATWGLDGKLRTPPR